jgi:hypothetical protein
MKPNILHTTTVTTNLGLWVSMPLPWQYNHQQRYDKAITHTHNWPKFTNTGAKNSYGAQRHPICQLESVPTSRKETLHQPENPPTQIFLHMVTNQRDPCTNQQLSISNMPIMQHHHQNTQPHIQLYKYQLPTSHQGLHHAN